MTGALKYLGFPTDPTGKQMRTHIIYFFVNKWQQECVISATTFPQKKCARICAAAKKAGAFVWSRDVKKCLCKKHCQVGLNTPANYY